MLLTRNYPRPTFDAALKREGDERSIRPARRFEIRVSSLTEFSLQVRDTGLHTVRRRISLWDAVTFPNFTPPLLQFPLRNQRPRSNLTYTNLSHLFIPDPDSSKVLPTHCRLLLINHLWVMRRSSRPWIIGPCFFFREDLGQDEVEAKTFLSN